MTDVLLLFVFVVVMFLFGVLALCLPSFFLLRFLVRLEHLDRGERRHRAALTISPVLIAFSYVQIL